MALSNGRVKNDAVVLAVRAGAENGPAIDAFYSFPGIGHKESEIAYKLRTSNFVCLRKSHCFLSPKRARKDTRANN